LKGTAATERRLIARDITRFLQSRDV
jgi:hypothetical protein